eukprot:10263041-Alexandrium_andersonii.AAC.1
MAQASQEDLVLVGQGCAQGVAMINLAMEQVKQQLNNSKPLAQSIAHYTKVVERAESQIVKIDEQIAALTRKRNEWTVRRQDATQQVVFHQNRLDQQTRQRMQTT